MNFLMVISLSLLSWSSTANEINQMRSLFIQGIEGDIEECYEYASEINESAISLAYKGASLSMMAENGFNPVTKLNRFDEGKTLMERAVSLDPESPEIRFLRFCIQSEAPGFLGYNDEMNEDMKIIKTKLENGWFDFDSKYKEVVSYMLAKNS